MTIDTNSDVVSEITVTLVGAPQNGIVSSDGKKIYTCSRYSNIDEITVINANTKDIEHHILLGDVDPYGMAIAKNKLYVTGTYTGKVYIIDLDAQSENYLKVLKTISVGSAAYYAVSSATGEFVYISHNTTEGKVTIINADTDEVVKTILTGGEPKGMAVSGNILYVVNYGDDTIIMINTDSNEMLVLDSPLNSGGNGPENLIVSPDGNRIYVVHHDAGSVEVLGYE